jgi:hypothetical protein
MDRRKFLVFLCCCLPLKASSQVLDFSSANSRTIERFDRSKTVVIIPVAILEEHGPYLPTNSDGIFSQRRANDLGVFVASQPGWRVGGTGNNHACNPHPFERIERPLAKIKTMQER